MARIRGSSDKTAVIDLFSGPGGLGEGFTSLEVDGRYPFEIVLSAEVDPMAQQTLELRAFFRKFRESGTPKEYWQHLCRKITREELFAAHPRESRSAIAESARFKLGRENRRELEGRLDALGLDRDNSIVIGGPPCQAYSVVGRSRSSAKRGWSLETDERSRLYREYLHVLAHVQPIAFVMENVRGLLSAKFGGTPVFDLIRRDLQDPRKALRQGSGGRRYRLIPLDRASDSLFGEPAPEDFLLRSEEYGVPQARHRVIIFGVAEDVTGPATEFLPKIKRPATVRSAIEDLPRLRSGLSGGRDNTANWKRTLLDAVESRWFKRCEREVRDALRAAVEAAFSADMGRGDECLSDGRRRKPIYNHSTRGHMETDLHRYLFAAAFARIYGRSPTLESYPTTLLPNHANVSGTDGRGMFNDRFRVQCWDEPSTTIVSHISKDGHYYIHPDPSQCRSLTVREAARLQTFPDDYYFCGPRTAQYQQVGNAVPVRLARQIARAVMSTLS